MKGRFHYSTLLSIGRTLMQVAGILTVLIAFVYIIASNGAAWAQDEDPGTSLGPPNTRITPTATPTPYPTFVPGCNRYNPNSCNTPTPVPTATATPRPTNTPTPTPTPTPIPDTPTPEPPLEAPPPTPTFTPTPTPEPPPPPPPRQLPRVPRVTEVEVTATTPLGETKRVDIRWSFIEGASTYRVERRISNRGSWGPVLPLRDSGYYQAAQGRTWGDIYPASCDGKNYFRVAAYGDGFTRRVGYGFYSDVASISTTSLGCAEPEPPPPLAPPVVSLPTSVNHGEVVLTWSPVNGATDYIVEQRVSNRWISLPSTELAGVTIHIAVRTSIVVATISGLEPGEMVIHRVKARNSRGTSRPSDEVSVSVEDQRPEVITRLRAEDMIGGRGIRLTWQTSDGAESYGVAISSGDTSPTVTNTGRTRVEFTGLYPGTLYNFEVTAINEHGTRSDKLDGIVAPEVTQAGHQADHTAKYVIGTMNSDVIRNAIEPAVATWNSELRSSPLTRDLDLRICAEGDCGADNSDGFIVTIQTAGRRDACNHSLACIFLFTDNSGHLEDLEMFFEQPPWGSSTMAPNSSLDSSPVSTEYEWTNNEASHGKPVEGNDLGVRYFYVGRAILHEFGHALGLHDFYEDSSMANLSALMNRNSTVEEEDLTQLRAIYLLHEKH